MIENLAVGAVSFLLKSGANPNQIDASGWTPLHLSIDTEADYFNQNPRADQKDLPSSEVTALLLQYGADPHMKALDGRTPMELAGSLRNTRALELMQQH
jgi:ankyrin repeat protein